MRIPGTALARRSAVQQRRSEPISNKPVGRGISRHRCLICRCRLPGLQRLTALVHRYGSQVFAQINHCGRQTLPWAMGRDEAVSASAVQEKIIGTKPRALMRSEISGIVSEHAEAADRAVRAGFDGVQLRVGHGYLLNQFLTPYTNRRTDAYGGSPENRQRLLCEIYDACREAVGPDFPLIAKINGHDRLAGRDGLDTTALVNVVRMLEDRGLGHAEDSGHLRGRVPDAGRRGGRCAAHWLTACPAVAAGVLSGHRRYQSGHLPVACRRAQSRAERIPSQVPANDQNHSHVLPCL